MKTLTYLLKNPFKTIFIIGGLVFLVAITAMIIKGNDIEPIRPGDLYVSRVNNPFEKGVLVTAVSGVWVQYVDENGDTLSTLERRFNYRMMKKP